MEITGIIKVIGNTEQVGSNGFLKREMVISTQETYPQHISIQFTQDKCDLLNALQLGQKVNVHFNLRGREWTSPQGETKYFNTLEAWRVQVIQVTNVANQQQGYQQQGYQNPSYQVPSGQGTSYQAQPTAQQPPVYQNPQQPTQTQMFDNNGQAPVQSQEDFSDLPF